MSQLKLQGVDVRDEIKQPLYDTIDIKNGDSVVQERRFFSQAQGKSKVETNLVTNGALERDKSFLILGISIEATNMDATKLELLDLYANYSYIQLQLTDKPYYTAPLRQVTGKIYHEAMTTASDTSICFQQYGSAGANPVIFSGNHALPISPLSNFYVAWNVSGASAAQQAKMEPTDGLPVRFVCKLNGILRRPVQ